MATGADQQLATHLPAPKTFAPSREDVLSTLSFFFGDPAVPEKLRDYSEHHAMCAAHRQPSPHKRPLTSPLRLQDVPLPGRLLRPEHVSASLKPRSPPKAASREQ